MAAATTASSYFTSRSHPRIPPDGRCTISTNESLATTTIDDVGDIYKIYPVRDKQRLAAIILGNHGDADTNGTPTLDADIVLVDDNGTTILFNAGTEFQAARTTPLIIQTFDSDNNPYVEVDDTDGDAYIGIYVNTVSATPAAVRWPMTFVFEG